MNQDSLIWVADANMRITWVSHGPYVEEVQGKTILECLAEGASEKLSLGIGRTMLTGSPVTTYYAIYDGSTWVTTIYPSSISRVAAVFHSHKIPCLPDHLTRREIDVMCRLMNGLRAGEIQKDLGISASTYAEHQQNAMSKTRTSSPAELAVCAALMRLDQYLLRGS